MFTSSKSVLQATSGERTIIRLILNVSTFFPVFRGLIVMFPGIDASDRSVRCSETHGGDDSWGCEDEGWELS